VTKGDSSVVVEPADTASCNELTVAVATDRVVTRGDVSASRDAAGDVIETTDFAAVVVAVVVVIGDTDGIDVDSDGIDVGNGVGAGVTNSVYDGCGYGVGYGVGAGVGYDVGRSVGTGARSDVGGGGVGGFVTGPQLS
jgi:hypothetical protein